MANWSGLILTAAGKQLEAEMRAGQRLINFTKMKIGSGVPTGDVEHMTDLVNPKKEILLSGKRVVSNTMLQLTAILTNTDVTEGFTVNELGVYANDSKDSGYREVLYGVIIDPKGDYLSAAGGALAESLIFNVLIGTSNAANITATLTPDGLLTVEQLNDAMNLHNTSTTAHTQLFTTDSTPATDADTTSSAISKLGARIKWVKNYVSNKITDTLKTVDTQISNALSTYKKFKASQIADFAEAVIIAIHNKTFSTLGVQWSFTNPNAWYICFGVLFGGLIIQGGATGRPMGNAATAKFGIAFNSADYIIIPVGVIDANDTKWGLTVNVLKDYKTATNCTFRTSDSIAPACYYLAIGA